MNVTASADATRATLRALVADGRFDEAWSLLRAELIGADGTAAWSMARNLLVAGARAGWSPPAKRQARLAVLCGYEAAELSEQLRVACLALFADVTVYTAPFGQLEQELLSPDSGLARFEPTHVLLAPSAADLGFGELAEDPEGAVAAELQRWRGLWERARGAHGARVLQHGFVVPDETPLGHLSLRLAGSRITLVRELNRQLAQAAGDEILLVDTERLASRLGKRHWLDPRLWYRARQAVSADGLAMLARETAAVLAADLGLAARCLVTDLDNTLWGGIVGEDGVDGIVVGEGPDGEAYCAFQDYLAALHRRGIVLAVASKNDREAALAPFAQATGMRLTPEHFAAFVADWRRKPEQIREIAETLGLGLDALVFVDDNPAECAEVASALPEVTTICLDMPVSERVRKLASCVRFELTALSAEDERRQRSYAARAHAAELEASAGSLEDFWRSLRMRARVRPLDERSLERAAQLTQKTNQFNLTLRRHSREQIELLAGGPRAICRTLELEDRFASHGLIGLAIVVPAGDDDTALIDTLLLSCRVIGRTAEVHMLSHLSRAALDAGFSRLRGIYVPGPRNALVADLYPRLGFTASRAQEHCWDYDLQSDGPIVSDFIHDEVAV